MVRKPRWPLLGPLILQLSLRSLAFTVTSTEAPHSLLRSKCSALGSTSSHDTPEILPQFGDEDEYMDYLKEVSALPKGFSTGIADGTFVSVEAPALGSLKIRGTLIVLPEGPTDSWAACFTSNKVSTGARSLLNMWPRHLL